MRESRLYSVIDDLLCALGDTRPFVELWWRHKHQHIPLHVDCDEHVLIHERRLVRAPWLAPQLPPCLDARAAAGRPCPARSTFLTTAP